jgi:hypothetical protein
MKDKILKLIKTVDWYSLTKNEQDALILIKQDINRGNFDAYMKDAEYKKTVSQIFTDINRNILNRYSVRYGKKALAGTRNNKRTVSDINLIYTHTLSEYKGIINGKKSVMYFDNGTNYGPIENMPEKIFQQKLKEAKNKLGTINTDYWEGKPTFLSKIKKGELFRFAGKKTVYVYDGKLTRGYFHYHKFDDYNDNKQTKTDRHILINFTF